MYADTVVFHFKYKLILLLATSTETSVALAWHAMICQNHNEMIRIPLSVRA